MPFAILWPTFALVALIFVVWLVLFVQRFAHLKRNLNFRRLRLRGLSGAKDEFLLAAAAQNLRKLIRFLGQGPPTGQLCAV